MSRIAACMEQLKAQGKKALVPYFVSGDPSIDITVPLMHAMVESGADILEIGVPFSDPAAEGPVIQLAHERALENDVSLSDTLDLIKTFRQKDNTTPIVLMGYCNPVEIMGYENFAKLASAAGVDGLLTVDLPPEEAGDFTEILRQHNMDNIFLIAPTTTTQRIKLIAAQASGYLYYVSLKGVTGAGNLDFKHVGERVALIKSITDVPICVGFGIKDPESAKQIAQFAEGAVVGSALVDRMASAKSADEAIAATTPFLQSLRQAIDS
ncbi:MAG: tryptophan synthase subunit alpha [Pseudomonadales bacterium]|nr:tryptophan synthase subunit alpha [Pseudomonadales bacterium]